MFDISLAELLLIVVVAVVFIGPKDLPIVIKTVAKFIKVLRDFSHEIKQTFDDLANEAGASEIKETLDTEMRLIKGDDGKMYESYQVHKPVAKKYSSSAPNMPDIIPDIIDTPTLEKEAEKHE